jgi:hypothetical protein
VDNGFICGAGSLQNLWLLRRFSEFPFSSVTEGLLVRAFFGLRCFGSLGSEYAEILQYLYNFAESSGEE